MKGKVIATVAVFSGFTGFLIKSGRSTRYVMFAKIAAWNAYNKLRRR